jgi:hypothetical protein
MRCQRCNVVMVNERFYGPGDPFWGWRCVLCGNISDPIILENRNQGVNLAANGKKGYLGEIFEEGETIKGQSTGRIFELKKRTDQFVILQSLDGSTQVLTG